MSDLRIDHHVISGHILTFFSCRRSNFCKIWAPVEVPTAGLLPHSFLSPPTSSQQQVASGRRFLHLGLANPTNERGFCREYREKGRSFLSITCVESTSTCPGLRAVPHLPYAVPRGDLQNRRRTSFSRDLDFANLVRGSQSAVSIISIYRTTHRFSNYSPMQPQIVDHRCYFQNWVNLTAASSGAGLFCSLPVCRFSPLGAKKY